MKHKQMLMTKFIIMTRGIFSSLEIKRCIQGFFLDANDPTLAIILEHFVLITNNMSSNAFK